MRNYKGIENEEEFTNILLDESLLEEEFETLHINELHCSINPKLLPKEPSSIIRVSKESNFISEIPKNRILFRFFKRNSRFYVIGNSTLSKKNGIIKKKSNGFHSVKDRESSLALTENGDLEQNLRNNGLNLTKASKNCSF